MKQADNEIVCFEINNKIKDTNQMHPFNFILYNIFTYSEGECDYLAKIKCPNSRSLCSFCLACFFPSLSPFC